ncbi:hypothetical protein WG66_006747 [Moniliophthora roreri]|nr:hypothetical protein WG66_006747 [Moniliophthora roreri]
MIDSNKGPNRDVGSKQASTLYWPCLSSSSSSSSSSPLLDPTSLLEEDKRRRIRRISFSFRVDLYEATSFVVTPNSTPFKALFKAAFVPVWLFQ